MGLKLTPGSKKRLLGQLEHLQKMVLDDHDRDIITFYATEMAHHAVGLCNYIEPEVPKKIKKSDRLVLKRTRKPHRCDGIIDPKRDGIIRGHDW